MAVVVGLAESPTPIPIHIRPANSHGTLGATANSLAVFLIAIAVWGIAYSLSFLGGLTVVNAAAPDRHRAASLSAFYLVAYFVQGAVALLLGLAANWGLRLAIHLGTAAVHGDGNRCHSPHHCRPAFCRRIGLQMTWWNGDRRDVSDCNSAVALRRRLADRMLRAFQFKKRKPRRPKATHCTHAHERECPSQKGSAEFKLRVAAGGGDSCRQTRRPLRVLLYRR
jgi:hypothetical protein